MQLVVVTWWLVVVNRMGRLLALGMYEVLFQLLALRQGTLRLCVYKLYQVFQIFPVSLCLLVGVCKYGVGVL